MKFQEVQESGEGAVKCAQIAHAGGGRELPILFSPQMIRALPPRGPKSQTRRTRGLEEINESPDDWKVEAADAEAATLLNRMTGELRTIRCPYGPAGTRLWVKEGWRAYEFYSRHCDVMVTYLADGEQRPFDEVPIDWRKPSAGKYGGAITALFMPRWASRFTFVSTGWRLERVQQISEDDVVAEGTEVPTTPDFHRLMPITGHPLPSEFSPKRWHEWTQEEYFRLWYARLWDSINGKKLPWSRNPWCWVIGFEVAA